MQSVILPYKVQRNHIITIFVDYERNNKER